MSHVSLITLPTMPQIVEFFGWGDSIPALVGISLVLTLGVVFFVIVVGFFMSLVERFQFWLLAKVFNWSFACFFHNRLTFPGLVMHECAHAAFAMVTGSRVTEISVFDDDPGYIGHIRHEPRGPRALQAVQRTMCSCAPVIVGLALGVFMLKWILFGDLPLWGKGILCYLEICVLNHISMSDVDLSHYVKNVWIFILPIFGIFLAKMMIAFF